MKFSIKFVKLIVLSFKFERNCCAYFNVLATILLKRREIESIAEIEIKKYTVLVLYF